MNGAYNEAAVPHYYGHRERLRDRFRQHGAESLPDYELMELILFRAIPRRDTKPLAKAIIGKSAVLRKPSMRARTGWARFPAWAHRRSRKSGLSAPPLCV